MTPIEMDSLTAVTSREALKMLREDTGTALCDSGGRPVYDENGKYLHSVSGYGRAFERDRGRQFEAEPEITCKFGVRHQTLDTTASVYWWLVNNFIYDAKTMEEFNQFMEEHDDELDTYLDAMLEFGKRWKDEGPCDGYTGYTYNYECLLDRDVQYLIAGDHVLLQIHNGCDARGGLTRPVAFLLKESDGFMPDVARAMLVAIDPKVTRGQKAFVGWPAPGRTLWETENAGYSWRLDSDHRVELGHFDMTEDESKRGKGAIFVDPQGNGYCPLTGGLLEPFMCP
jgi:hypothetical protein